MTMLRSALVGALLLSTVPLFAAADAKPPARDYYAYVCGESEDVVYLVRFGPGGFEVAKEIPVGSFPAEIEGPHGINVSPDGRHWFVSIAHGQPFGTIHKFSTGDDEWLGDAVVGMFPATLDVSATTGLLYVVNSDFYGDHVPSTISVVETRSMTEVAQIDTGTMPHGSRLSADGAHLYSVNMMDDELVEVDALRFEIRRRLPLGTAGPADSHGTDSHGADSHRPDSHRADSHGADSHGAATHRTAHGEMDHGEEDHRMAGHDGATASGDPHDGGAQDATAEDAGNGPEAQHAGHPMATPQIEPAWVSPPTADGRIYIAALSAAEVLEVDLDSWQVTRRFDTAPGPYNVAVDPAGRLLVVTYKKSNAVGFWDLASGEELARIETTRRIPHGVAITSDGRFSLVTVEGVGGEPGVVEVYDNEALQRVAHLEIGKQAGGIATWDPAAAR